MILIGLVVLVLVAAYLGQVLGFTVVAVVGPLVLILAWCFGWLDGLLNRWLDRVGRRKPPFD